MGWFAKRRARLNAELAATIAQALAEHSKSTASNPPDAVAEFYNKSLGGMSAFLNQAGELALTGAMRAMGSRGGKRSQQRRRERLEAQRETQREAPQCELCRDPFTRNVSIASITEHRRHEQIRKDPNAQSRLRGIGQAANGNGNGNGGESDKSAPADDTA